MIETNSMLEQLTNYVQNNANKWIKSPRNEIFGSRTVDFKLSFKSKEIIRFDFISGNPLSIDFNRINLAIEFMDSKKSLVRIGAATKELGHPDSLEHYLKMKTGVSTKTAPHIADLFVLAGFAEFDYITPPKGKKVQGIRLK